MIFSIDREIILGVRKNLMIRLQLLTDDWAVYCVQYAGNGQYFETLRGTEAYLWKRWKLKIPDIFPRFENRMQYEQYKKGETSE